MRLIALALVVTAMSTAVAAAPEEATVVVDASPERVAELRALKRAWLSRKVDDARVRAHEHAVEGTAAVATGIAVPVASIGAALGVASVASQLQGDGAKVVNGVAIGLGVVGFASILALPVVLAGGLVRFGEVEELEHEVELREAKLASFDASRLY